MTATNGFTEGSKTVGYVATQPINANAVGQPWGFSRYEIEQMDKDPRVRIGFRILCAPVEAATWKIECDDPDTEEFLDRTITQFWQADLTKALGYLKYGSLGAEPVYDFDEDAGEWNYKTLKDFHISDVRPLHDRGDVVGINVYGVQDGVYTRRPIDPDTPRKKGSAVSLLSPSSFWIANEPKHSSFYGFSRYEGAFEPWKEKRGKHGAIDVRRNHMIRNSCRGAQMRYPEGESLINGTMVANQDIARQMVEGYMAGEVLAMPNTFNKETGRYEWEWVEPEVLPEATGILKYPPLLDTEILEGMEIWPEVLQAPEVGAGWSGRAIPFLMFLSSEDGIVRTTLQAFVRQVCRPLVTVNRGNVRFRVRAVSLLPKQQPEQAANPGVPDEEIPPPGLGGDQGITQVPEAIAQPQNAEDATGMVMAHDVTRRFSSTQFDLPPALAERVLAMGRKIDPADLAEDGCEEEPHVTVKYGLHTGNPEKVRRAVEGSGPVTMTLGKTSIFPAKEASAQRGGERFDVVKIDVFGHGLHELNRMIAESLENTDTHPTYQPHVTVAYVKPGAGQKYASMGDVDQEEFTADCLTFSDHDDARTSIALQAEEESPGANSPINEAALAFDAPEDAVIRQAVLAGVNVSDEVRAKLRQAVRQWSDEKKNSTFDLIRAISDILEADEPRLAMTLAQGIVTAWLDAGKDVADKADVKALPEGVFKFDAPPLKESGPDFPRSNAAAQFLADKAVFTQGDFDDLSGEARMHGMTVARLATLDAVEKVRDALAEHAVGGDLRSFTDRVRQIEQAYDESAMSARQIEAVYRTGVGQAAKAGQLSLLSHPMIGEEFPYVLYIDVADSRQRKTHAWFGKNGLDGTNVYRRDDPIWDHFWAPWETNCRCKMIPISLTEAARRGIKEAIAWVDSGTPPVHPQFVVPPPFPPPQNLQTGLRLGFDQVQLSFKDWVQMPLGPRGGKKWRNSKTGKEVYSKQNPGAISAHTMHAQDYARRIGVNTAEPGHAAAAYKVHKDAVHRALVSGQKVSQKALEAHPELKNIKVAPAHVVKAVSPEAVPEAKVETGSTAGLPEAKIVDDKQVPRIAKLIRHMDEEIDGTVDMTDIDRENHKGAIRKVLQSMPAKAKELMAANVNAVSFYATSDDLKDDLVAEGFSQFADENRKPLGVYRTGKESRKLYLDGSDAANQGFERGVHAHEYSHAVDGPNNTYSRTQEWKDIAQEEFSLGDRPYYPLSKYATENEAEGFAEFGRMVHGSDKPREEIEAEFPKATAFWKKHGIM